jgi:tetratricopeptide (TPR) repeat protein
MKRKKKHLNKPKVAESKKEQVVLLKGWKLYLFRVIAVFGIPVLLLSFLELGLHLIDYGYNPDAIIKCEVKGGEVYSNNPKFGQRFFPKSIYRLFQPFNFSVKKQNNTYRIFVLGGSAALGSPDAAYSFGRILEKMLVHKYPGTNFEVVNVAMAAINSHVVLEIAKDCAKYEPDLFLVYLGNNEVVGPYGPGTVFTPLLSKLPIIRISIFVKTTKLGQLIKNVSESKGSPRLWSGLEMFLDKQIRHDDSQMKSVYLNFERNLESICEIAHENNTEVILSTVAVNLKDSPPFASLHKESMTESEKENWGSIYQQGIEAETKQQWAKAAEYYLNAAIIDEQYAELQYRLALCYWKNADYNNAAKRYEKALEYDTLRFRADKGINEVIRNIGRDRTSKKMSLLDFAKTVKIQSDNNLPGENFFHEHVHLNFKGNYLLARSFFEKIETRLPERINKFKNKSRKLLNEQQASDLLAYTSREKISVANKILVSFIKKPPFTNRLYNKQRVAEDERKLKELRQKRTPDVVQRDIAQYQYAIEQAPGDWWVKMKYANFLFFEQNKDFAAAKQYELILSDFLPNHDVALVNLGMFYGKHNYNDSAIEVGLKTLRLFPTGAIAVASHVNLGVAYRKRNDVTKAESHYRLAMQLDSHSIHAYLKLSKLLYSQSKFDQSSNVCREGIKFIPESESLHYGLAVSLQAMGLKKKAKAEFMETIRLAPDHKPAKNALKALSGNYK